MRLKCGTVREDGMIFWSYSGEREYWLTPDKFQIRKLQSRACTARRNKTEAGISYRKKWRQSAHFKEYNRSLKRKPYYQKYANERVKAKRKSDPMFRLRCACTDRVRQYLKGRRKSTMEIVGISIGELRNYLEIKFLPGMSWDNYGRYGWHVDHIIPLASAKNKEEIIRLCHYSNLQPLWAADNISKGAKI